jgi:plastocyanin
MRLIGSLVIVVAAALPACSDAGSGPGGCTPSATRVCMTGSSFNPSTLTVGVGTSVTWSNESGVPHTVTSDPSAAEAFDSDVSDGGTFTRQFDAAGSYPYHCEIHSGMNGTLTVSP